MTLSKFSFQLTQIWEQIVFGLCVFCADYLMKFSDLDFYCTRQNKIKIQAKWQFWIDIIVNKFKINFSSQILCKASTNNPRQMQLYSYLNIIIRFLGSLLISKQFTFQETFFLFCIFQLSLIAFFKEGCERTAEIYGKTKKPFLER